MMAGAEAPGLSPLAPMAGFDADALLFPNPFTSELDFAALLDNPIDDNLLDLPSGSPTTADGSPGALGSLAGWPSQNEMGSVPSSEGSGSAQQESNEAQPGPAPAGKQLDKTELQKERVRAKNRRWVHLPSAPSLAAGPAPQA